MATKLTKSTTICNRNNSAGGCKFGEECLYRHVDMCWFNTQGKCKFGKKCKKDHIRLCKNFNTDAGCRFGEKCSFSHVKTMTSEELQNSKIQDAAYVAEQADLAMIDDSAFEAYM
jgi:hypothetical protein